VIFASSRQKAAIGRKRHGVNERAVLAHITRHPRDPIPDSNHSPFTGGGGKGARIGTETTGTRRQDRFLTLASDGCKSDSRRGRDDKRWRPRRANDGLDYTGLKIARRKVRAQPRWIVAYTFSVDTADNVYPQQLQGSVTRLGVRSARPANLCFSNDSFGVVGRLFGCHVTDRAKRGLTHRQPALVLIDLGQPEVGYVRFAVGVDQDIPGLLKSFTTYATPPASGNMSSALRASAREGIRYAPQWALNSHGGCLALWPFGSSEGADLLLRRLGTRRRDRCSTRSWCWRSRLDGRKFNDHSQTG
jgi:hypothetical protein